MLGAPHDDDGDERLLAEAHVHRDRQEDDRQQDELDEGGGAGPAELLMAFAPSNPAPMLSSAIGVAQPPSMLRNLSAIGGKSIDSSEKRQTGENAEDDRLVMMPRSVRLTTP